METVQRGNGQATRNTRTTCVVPIPNVAGEENNDKAMHDRLRETIGVLERL